MVKRFLFCFFSVFLFIYSQGSSRNTEIFFPKFYGESVELDSLLGVADRLYEHENYDASLELYTKIIQKSKKEKYSKGLVKAYLGNAAIYFIKGKIDVSTEFLILAKNEPFTQTSPVDLYTICFREALNLHALGMHREAINKYKEAIEISTKIADYETKINKRTSAIINIGDIYEFHNVTDSALYYYKIALKTPNANSLNKFTSAISISEVYTDENKLDSAGKYLENAHDYLQSLNSTHSTAVYAKVKGKFWVAKGENEKGIMSYKNSLQLHDQLKTIRPELFKLLSEAYQKNGDKELSIQNLERYVEVNDSLSKVDIKNLKGPLLMIKSDNEKELAKAESYTWMIILFSFLFILILVVSIYFLLKKQKVKNLKGKKEKQRLVKKLNNAFEEVVDLAESNSPNFMSRFIEVYPEFYNQLISEFPNLTSADLKLCALMKLDFSTKEMAEITFSSVRTIQNRKYKLRKKFDLHSDENIQMWIQNFHLESIGQI